MEAIEELTKVPRQKYFFAVVDILADIVVGDVGFTAVGNATADCGWFIRERFWGRGFATEAVKQMIKVAFTETEIDTLVASCVDENRGSRRVMEKCGFHEYLHSHDRVGYRLSRNTWRESQPNQALQPTRVICDVGQTKMSEQSDMADAVARRLESGPVPVADLVEEVHRLWGPAHGVSEVHGFVREVATCLLWDGDVEVGDLEAGIYRPWRLEPEDADARIETELMKIDRFVVDRQRIVFRKKSGPNQPPSQRGQPSVDDRSSRT